MCMVIASSSLWDDFFFSRELIDEVCLNNFELHLMVSDSLNEKLAVRSLTLSHLVKEVASI